MALITAALSNLDQVDKNAQKAAQSPSSLSAKSIAMLDELHSDTLSISTQNSDEHLSGAEKSYYREIIQRLKLCLKLPEYGQVQLKLTLSRAGKTLSVQVLSSKSRKNQKYLEEMLPKITFSSFGTNFSNEKSHTFMLNITNDL